MFNEGDVVFCRNATFAHAPGIVKKVGRKYITVDWGSWDKKMLPQHLVKPLHVAMPSMSGDGYTVDLVQPGGEEFPPALTWAVR